MDKFWIVRSVRPDGQLELVTRTGKLHTIPPDDPRLRPLRWWERWTFRQRFAAIEDQLKLLDDSGGDNSPPDAE